MKSVGGGGCREERSACGGEQGERREAVHLH